MRLISQDRCIDSPYENNSIYIEEVKDERYIIRIDFGDYDQDMGIYSTKEKALSVMEMIRQSFSSYIGESYFYMPQYEEV